MHDLILRGGTLHDGSGSAGFVDPLSHAGTVPFMAEAQPFKLWQGVTTEIAGDRGFSCGPSTPEPAGEGGQARELHALADGVFHTMHDDVTRIVRHPLVPIGSDGGPPAGPNHPRTSQGLGSRRAA